jgi:hypothetical protein
MNYPIIFIALIRVEAYGFDYRRQIGFFLCALSAERKKDNISAISAPLR